PALLTRVNGYSRECSPRGTARALGEEEAMPTLVIGEALVDVVRENGRTNSVPGGSPANVALGLARLGREVLLHTTLGDDEAGRAVRAHLGESGVVFTSESTVTAPTTIATADIGESGDAIYSFAL